MTTHFTGRVRLARAPLADEVTAPAPSPDGKGTTADAIYGVYFHGPAYQVLERAWRGEQGPVGPVRDRSAGRPRAPPNGPRSRPRA